MATETTPGPAADRELKQASSFEGDEKADVALVQDVPIYDTLQIKRLLRKIDWHLIPFLSLLYLLSFLDRTNIGNAKLFGLETALGLEGMEYNTALSVFFVTYVLFEVPSNMVLKRWRASMWFPIMMLAWGVTMTLTGLVTNFNGLVIARVFLGMAEAGLFPGVNYYITLWYCRRECAFRAAIFFSAATVAGAFGGLLARGINEMDGLGGKAGWAWIFILEGMLTVLVALLAFWAMADSPATASFLSPEEAQVVSLRLAHDNDDLASHYEGRFVRDAFVDWRIWCQAFAYIGILVPLYSFSLFLPSIIRGMGYSDAMSQLLTVPPYVLGCILTVLGGYFSDRVNQRAVFLVGYSCSAILGYVLLLSTDIPAVQYIGTFLAACGVYPMVPIMVMWNGNNIGGSTKRGVGLAIQIAFGNCGGVVSSFIYRNQDSPKYYLGHGVCLGFLVMALGLVLFQWFILGRINQRRDEEHPRPGEYTTEMKRAEMDRGDQASFFRYTR